jgi:thiamine biosynthesis lipoprotein
MRPHTYEHQFTAMAGRCRLQLEHADQEAALVAIEQAEAEVRRLEQKYTRYQDSSLTSTINRNAGTGKPTPIDPETFALLNHANTLWQQSDGLFDLTSGVLRRAWNFRSGQLPSAQQIESLLPLVGWQHLQWSEHAVLLPNSGMELDFGGLVKEYACDAVAMILHNAGIHSALVDLAGDMAAIGQDQARSVGIRHPRQTGALARITLQDSALASSGDYERCLIIDGQRYGHILNPHTGWPSRGLIAVSIVAPQCLVAGSAATIAMLKPPDQALQWLGELGLAWLAVDAELACHGSLDTTQLDQKQSGET